MVVNMLTGKASNAEVLNQRETHGRWWSCLEVMLSYLELISADPIFAHSHPTR